MPLWIDGTESSQQSATEYKLLHESFALKQSAASLLNQPEKEVNSKGLLYVHQREYAAVAPDDTCIHVLGTDDATTCHIAIMRHTGSGVTSLAHCDGCGMEAGIQNMVKLVMELSHGAPEGRLELHLAGGFIDDNGISKKLTQDLLDIFSKVQNEVYLVTACVNEFNDVLLNGTHYPSIYGLAVDVRTGTISNAVFPDRGPDINLRSAVHFVGSDKMLNIYDNKTQQLTIEAYDWLASSSLDMWLSLPDRILLKHMSTSPEQERPHFISHVRSTLQLLVSHPEPSKTLFPNGVPRRYRKAGDGIWTRVS